MKDIFAEKIAIVACEIQIICNNNIWQKIFSLAADPYGPHCLIVVRLCKNLKGG